jgi:hypothetical protein
MALTMSAWFNPDNAAVHDRQRLMCVGMIWRFLAMQAACRTLITLLLMIGSASFPFWQRFPFPDKMMWGFAFFVILDSHRCEDDENYSHK